MANSAEPSSQRYLLLARRRIFSLELEQIDEALEYSQQELALADSDRDRTRAEHFQAFIYCALCMIAHVRGEWDNLADWATVGDTITRRVGHQVELSELLAWRAVSARKAGEEERTLRLYRSAYARMKAQRMPPTRGFYEGLCAYHDLSGDLPAMLAVRDRELKDVSGWGRFLSEVRCRIQRCRLLARAWDSRWRPSWPRPVRRPNVCVSRIPTWRKSTRLEEIPGNPEDLESWSVRSRAGPDGRRSHRETARAAFRAAMRSARRGSKRLTNTISFPCQVRFRLFCPRSMARSVARATAWAVIPRHMVHLHKGLLLDHVFREVGLRQPGADYQHIDVVLGQFGAGPR